MTEEVTTIYKIKSSNSKVIIPIKIMQEPKDVSRIGDFTKINQALDDKIKNNTDSEGKETGDSDTGITGKVAQMTTTDNNKEFYENIKNNMLQVQTKKISQSDNNEAIEYLENNNIIKPNIVEGQEYAAILWNDENPSTGSEASNYFSFIENFAYELDDAMFCIYVDADATLKNLKFFKGTNYTYKPVFLNKIVNYTIQLLSKNDEEKEPEETSSYTWYYNNQKITYILLNGNLNERITNNNNHKTGPIILKDQNGNQIADIADTTKTKLTNYSSNFELTVLSGNSSAELYIAFINGTLQKTGSDNCLLNYNNIATLNINVNIILVQFCILLLIEASKIGDGNNSNIFVTADYYQGSDTTSDIHVDNKRVTFNAWNDIKTEDQVYITNTFGSDYSVYGVLDTTNWYATRVERILVVDETSGLEEGVTWKESDWHHGLDSDANPQYVIYQHP